MKTAPNGRAIYLPIGREQTEDQCLLADCIAESNADLFARDGAVIWIAAGRCEQVSMNLLREICGTFVVTKQLVSRGDDVFEVAYVPYEPNEMTLRSLLTAKTRNEGGLASRLPKAPGRGVPAERREEAITRIRSGEPLAVIARHYAVDVDVVKELARRA